MLICLQACDQPVAWFLTSVTNYTLKHWQTTTRRPSATAHHPTPTALIIYCVPLPWHFAVTPTGTERNENGRSSPTGRALIKRRRCTAAWSACVPVSDDFTPVALRSAIWAPRTQASWSRIFKQTTVSWTGASDILGHHWKWRHRVILFSVGNWYVWNDWTWN